jgi:feruloyl esterase
MHLAHVTVASTASVAGGPAPPGSPSASGQRAFCAVSLKQADSSGNVITTDAWLPAAWNGRFEGVGGSYYSCGINESALAGGIAGGYATASTDCGIPPGHERTGQWGLRQDNTLNWPLISNFAYAGIHDMSVTGKAVTTAYYSQDPAYSYFQGRLPAHVQAGRLHRGRRQGLRQPERRGQPLHHRPR